MANSQQRVEQMQEKLDELGEEIDAAKDDAKEVTDDEEEPRFFQTGRVDRKDVDNEIGTP